MSTRSRTSRAAILLLGVLLVALMPRLAGAADTTLADFAKAAAAFDAAAARLSRDPAGAKAGLAQAASEFARLAAQDKLSDHSRAEALFNAGVAHHLAGNMGEAVLAYRRAAMIDSSIPGLTTNLARARATVAGTTTPADDARTANSVVSSALTLLWSLRPHIFAACLAAFVLTWVLLGIRLTRIRPSLIWPALSAAFAIALGAAVAWPVLHDRRSGDHSAVVRADATPRLGPDTLTFGTGSGGPLRAGTEVTIVEQRMGGDGRTWVKVQPRERSDAEGVWLPQSTIETVAAAKPA